VSTDTGKMDANSTDRMGTGNMWRLILSMGFPAALSMLVQSLYNIVDSIFVAKIGVNALTAVNLSFPIQNAIISIAVGTAIGINSLISRNLGAKNVVYAEKVANYGGILGALSSMFFAVFGFFGCRWFFSMFTDNEEIVNMGVNYLSIICIVSFGCFIQIAMEKIIQSTGNMIYPMITQLVGAIINIILDPIFIFGMFGVPKMGVAGAALATVIGQITAMFVGIYFLLKRQNLFKISLKGFKFELSVVKNIYKVAIPVALIQMLASIVVLFVNTALGALSSVGVAIIGIYIKLQSFILMPVFGIMQGVMPIAGYNFGARNKGRVVESYKVSIIINSTISLMGALMFVLASEQLLSMFNPTPEMLEIGVPALKILGSSFVFAGFGITTSLFFQAIGYGMSSLIISLLRQLIFVIPLVYILPAYIGINGVWIAYPVAEFISSILSVFMLRHIYKYKICHL